MTLFLTTFVTIVVLGGIYLFDIYQDDSEKAILYFNRCRLLVIDFWIKLGETLLVGAIIGIYFFPDPKRDYTAALICGTISYILAKLAKKEK
jgi:hypothetical protein